MLAHLAGEMGEDFMPVIQLNTKHRARQHREDGALDLNGFFAAQEFFVVVGVFRRRCGNSKRSEPGFPVFTSRGDKQLVTRARPTATAGGVIFARTGFIDGERAAVRVFAGQGLNGRRRAFWRCHGDAGKAARSVRWLGRS